MRTITDLQGEKGENEENERKRGPDLVELARNTPATLTSLQQARAAAHDPEITRLLKVTRCLSQYTPFDEESAAQSPKENTGGP